MHRMTHLAVVLAPLAWATVAGCSSPPPPPDLKPVGGIVRTADGELFTSGGLIEFRHTSDYKKRSTSAIDEQGRFSLSTADAQSRHDGAFAGQYQVNVYRAVSFDQLVAAAPVTIPAEGIDDLEIMVAEPRQ